MSDWWWRDALAVLVWPGLLGSCLLGWFYTWLMRKLMARSQGRKGPPFYQPFFDFVKLMAKQTVTPLGTSRALFYALPLAAVVAVVIALALIPAPGNPIRSFSGDLIVLLYLLEMPALMDVLAGYASRSIYGQVSAMREALLTLGYNLSDLSVIPIGPVHLFAALAFLLAVPSRLKSNPFSIPNAEQEIVAGAHTEFNGVALGLFELAHTLEVVVLVGLFTVLFVPKTGNVIADLVLYLVGSVIVAMLVTLVAASTARLRIEQAFRFYWTWGALAAVAAFASAILL